MREVVPRTLWIGNAADARDWERILEIGIRAVIDLASEESALTFPRDVVSCRFPVTDGEQGLRWVVRVAIETVASLVRREVPTLVFCGAGMSRSPAILAAALSVARGGTPEDWLRDVVSGYPHDVSPRLWNDVTSVTAEMRRSESLR